jgi:hypothetical protein
LQRLSLKKAKQISWRDLGGHFDEMVESTGSSSSGQTDVGVKLLTSTTVLSEKEYEQCNEAWSTLRKGLKVASCVAKAR